MNKVICDICGTSFPDSATQCPICGSVRPADAPSLNDGKNDNARGYKHVKGGSFSKANVRKRNRAKGVVSVNVVSDVKGNEQKSGKSGKALVIVAVVLMLAIIAVAAYIILTYFGNSGSAENQGPVISTEESTEALIPCTGVSIDGQNPIILDSPDTARMLSVQVQPADSTDPLVFTSDNEEVAVVNEEGVITAVGPGKATITVTCGQYQASCEVECTFEDPNAESTDATESTEATEESTVPTIDPEAEFKLNRVDITFSRKDEAWVVYSGSIPLSAITWSSDDEKVATIADGKVVAVGPGMTTVHGEYKDTKVSCIIRCNFELDSENSGVTGNGGGVTEDGGGSVSGGSYRLITQFGDSAEDITISVGYSFSLRVVDQSGNTVSGATWTSGNSSVVTVSDGLVTGVAAGNTVISVSCKGQNFSCVIRVG